MRAWGFNFHLQLWINVYALRERAGIHSLNRVKGQAAHRMLDRLGLCFRMVSVSVLMIFTGTNKLSNAKLSAIRNSQLKPVRSIHNAVYAEILQFGVKIETSVC